MNKNEKCIIEPLTPVELATLLALLSGLKAHQVADKLYGGRIDMVEGHTRSIRNKAYADNTMVAAFRYIHLGMLPAEELKTAFEGDWQKR